MIKVDRNTMKRLILWVKPDYRVREGDILTMHMLQYIGFYTVEKIIDHNPKNGTVKIEMVDNTLE
jgi:hypothetical protein